jgi:cytochrome c biogenesis protein CcmG, thiol:disulfide interchange protein DsbE
VLNQIVAATKKQVVVLNKKALRGVSMVVHHLYKIASLLAVAMALLMPATAHANPKIGQPLPTFTVTTPSGQQVTNQNYSGRVLLLVFSTDYCSACKQAVPSIGKLADRYGKQGFQVLGLLSGFGWKIDELKKYMKTYGVTYPMALFEQQLAEDQFGMRSVPYSLLVGKKGVVAGVYYGYSDGTMKQVENQVKKLLAE